MKAVKEVWKIKILKQLKGGKKPLSQVIWAEISSVLGAGTVLEMSYSFLYRFKFEECNVRERNDIKLG